MVRGGTKKKERSLGLYDVQKWRNGRVEVVVFPT
jgi:hypothetical protein